MRVVILGMILVILRTTFEYKGAISTNDEDILLQILSTIPGLLNKLDLGVSTTVYAVCPRCHCLYPPKHVGRTSVQYPSVCTAKTDKSLGECGESLTKST